MISNFVVLFKWLYSVSHLQRSGYESKQMKRKIKFKLRIINKFILKPTIKMNSLRFIAEYLQSFGREQINDENITNIYQ